MKKYVLREKGVGVDSVRRGCGKVREGAGVGVGEAARVGRVASLGGTLEFGEPATPSTAAPLETRFHP